MKRVILGLWCLSLMGLSQTFVVASDDLNSSLSIDQRDKGVLVSDTLYGLFYEDINFGADGGLYAEQVYNRSFEYENIFNPTAIDWLTGWRVDFLDTVNGKLRVDTSNPLNENNDQSLNATVINSGYKLMNVGYTTNVSGTSANMSIFSEERYDLSFYLLNKTFEGKLTFYLEDGQGNLISNQKSVSIKKDTDWKKYDGIVLTGLESIGGRLVIVAEGVGEFNLDMVSLMPRAMYGANDPKWKYGGLRADLVAALRGLNPKFLRFPGGCVAEGAFDKENHYNWKDTIGPIEERKENPNLWGYMQSYGLGYHEYFQLSEDLGAEPVPVIHAGILCQARSGELMPMYPNTEEFEVLTQDILDLIEYANGDLATEYGKKRAENGHKESFDLKYVAIGNENWGAQYWNNFNVLKKAVLAVYPDITIITSAGPHSEGWIYDEAWNNVFLKHKDTYVDEHYYNTPQWFLDHTDRYDTYSRESAKVFIGEFAAHADPTTIGRPNTLYTALTEGAYLTGIERNSDVVKMISYAPLLARVGATQWTPDLIFFDSHGVMLTPDYYVLQLFSNHIGTQYLNTELISDLNLFQSVTVDETKEELYIKVVNPTGDATVLDITLSQFENMLPKGEWTVIHHENKEAQNTMTDKYNISPVTSITEVVEDKVTVEVKPYSANLIKLGFGKSKFEAGVLTEEEPLNIANRLILSVVIGGSLIGFGSMAFVYGKRKK